MHLRRLTLVSLAAPILFAACSSDNGARDTASGVQATGPGAPDQNRDGLQPSGAAGTGGGVVASGGSEGQNPDLQLQPSGSGGPPADLAPLGTVENRGSACEVADLPAGNTLPQSPNLPDPFTKLDGTRITKKSDWVCRRQEILKQVNQYIYGEKPVKPDSVTGTVTSTEITVNVQKDGQSESFTAAVSVPAGDGPFPALISYGGGNGGVPAIVAAMGVAVISYNQGAVGSRNSGIYGRLYPNNTSGDLAAWAWGASRIIDVLQAPGNTVIDSTKLAVTGCSFLGKAALATGALDERIALVIPRESGIGGVPSYRIVPQIEPNPTNSGTGPEQPQHAIDSGWLPGNSLVNDPQRLPVDTHEVLGLIAPRGVLVLGNTGGQAQYYLNLDYHTEYATTVASSKIFAALGVEANVSYDSRNVTHCDAGTGYTAAIQASVGKFLLGNNATTGAFDTDFEGIRTAPDQWVQWTTPTLEGDLP